MKFIKIIIRFTGILIFFYILSLINKKELLSIFTYKLHVPYFVISIALLPLGMIIKSYRWFVISEVFNTKLSFLNAYLIYSKSILYRNISPGGIGGDISRIVHMKNYHALDITESIFIILLDKIYDFIFIFFLGIVVLLYHAYNDFLLLFLFSLGYLVTIYFLFKLFSINGKILNFLKKIKFVSVPELLNSFENIKSKVSLSLNFKCIIITFISQIIIFIQVYFICKTLYLEFAIYYIVLISSLTALISFLPISIAGIGNRDALVIYIFSLSNIGIEYAVLFSTLYLIVFYIGTSTLGGLTFIFKPSNSMKQNKIDIKF